MRITTTQVSTPFFDITSTQIALHFDREGENEGGNVGENKAPSGIVRDFLPCKVFSHWPSIINLSVHVPSSYHKNDSEYDEEQPREINHCLTRIEGPRLQCCIGDISERMLHVLHQLMVDKVRTRDRNRVNYLNAFNKPFVLDSIQAVKGALKVF
ncbi:MAG: hypothetical protein J3R72DRAFT_509837 [Linnemannia gamsii]|nr:MAG: hypothetical protein J3R72DRAFT_509837 [Linnemannia gamsii]